MTSRKLTLRRETLAQLQVEDLVHVAGGVSTGGVGCAVSLDRECATLVTCTGPFDCPLTQVTW